MTAGVARGGAGFARGRKKARAASGEGDDGGLSRRDFPRGAARAPHTLTLEFFGRHLR